LGDTQVKTEKRYSMELRAAATEATRERIIQAAGEAFFDTWYDDVTLAAVAKAAGVSGQTVINHFGGKEGLFAAVQTRFHEEIVNRRYAPEPGDVAGVVDALVEDYEATGDAVIRLLALEEKVPAVQSVIALGRSGHREWVQTMFRAPELVPELVVATDVYSWKLLRRDQGLSPEETAAAIRRIIEALLDRRET
jgi:AcrR family transcriptional regulator